MHWKKIFRRLWRWFSPQFRFTDMLKAEMKTIAEKELAFDTLDAFDVEHDRFIATLPTDMRRLYMVILRLNRKPGVLSDAEERERGLYKSIVSDIFLFEVAKRYPGPHLDGVLAVRKGGRLVTTSQGTKQT